MTNDSTDALEQALALYATPDRLPLVRKRSLPVAVLQLIRIAAGDREALASASIRTAEVPQRIVDAALFYIQQVLFHETADSYRVLGVGPDAADDAIKEHYRWLTRWLHPDRHPERWEVVYSERVNRAWHSLNSGQRRSDYDAQQASGGMEHGIAVATNPRFESLRTSSVPLPHPAITPKAIRTTSSYVLGGFIALALAVLAWWCWVQYERQMEDMAATNKLDLVTDDDNASAQKAAIRRGIAFDEHVATLTRAAGLPITAIAARPTPLPANASNATETAKQSDTFYQPIAQLPAETLHGASAPDQPPSKSVAMQSLPVKQVQTESGRTPIPSTTANQQTATPRASDTRSNPGSQQPALRIVPPPALAAAIPPISPSRPPSPSVTPRTIDASTTVGAAPLSPVAATVATAGGVTAQEATAILPREFAMAYGKGDLTQMMRLFAPDAVDNRGGIDAITEDYQHLFASTSSRDLILDGMAWTIQTDRIVGNGAFRARIRRNGELFAKSIRGSIRIEAVPMVGGWKIQRILHWNAE